MASQRILFLLILIGALMALACEPVTPSELPTEFEGLSFEQLKEKSVHPSYDELFRNNEDWVGQAVHYQAELAQVVDGGEDRYQMRANITKSDFSWEDPIFLRYEGTRLREGDVIEFVGIVEGLRTYEAILGNQVTIPDISAHEVRLITESEVTIAPEEPGSSTSPPIGTSRSNPSPAGGFVMTESGVELTVVALNKDAEDVVIAENKFNDLPAGGNNFVLLRVQAKNVQGDVDEAIKIDAFDFRLTGSSAILYSLSDHGCGVIPDRLSITFFLGGAGEGNVCFEVPSDEMELVLSYAPTFSLSNSKTRWLAVE